MSDLCELVAKAGGRPSVKIQKPKTITFKNWTYTQNYDCYVISHNTSLFADVRNMTIEYKDYNDKVWCVELEKNHTLYVMYSWKVCISGNCRWFVNLWFDEKNSSWYKRNILHDINDLENLVKKEMRGKIKLLLPKYENPYKEALTQLSNINKQIPKGKQNKSNFVKEAYKHKSKIIKQTIKDIDDWKVKWKYKWYRDYPNGIYTPTIQIKIGKFEKWYHLPKQISFVPNNIKKISPKRKKES